MSAIVQPEESKATLKAKWARGELTTGLILRMSRGPEIAGIAKAAGVDACYVDMEHSPLSLDTAASLCLWLRQANVVPLIRVPSNAQTLISKALDAGAQGVIVPHVENESQAVRAVRAAKFPPMGNRSWSSGQPLLGYGAIAAKTGQEVLNRQTLVIVMIESRAAFDNIEEIASVAGIDMLLLGAGDLSTDFGIPGETRHPDIENAIGRTIKVCAKYGIATGLGGMAQDPESIKHWCGQGIRFVSLGTDIAMLVNGARSASRSVL